VASHVNEAFGVGYASGAIVIPVASGATVDWDLRRWLGLRGPVKKRKNVIKNEGETVSSYFWSPACPVRLNWGNLVGLSARIPNNVLWFKGKTAVVTQL
jgi:hypothetical protein